MPILEEPAGVFRLSVGDAFAEVALFGSTLLSWHPGASPPNYSAFFLSNASQPGKPYRGGVPIVFPLFGEAADHEQVPQLLKKVPRHGFCRGQDWKVSNKQDDQQSASISMSQ